MTRPITLPFFALTYLPAAMVSGAVGLVVLVAANLTTRGIQTPGVDSLAAASGLTLALLTVGAPQIVLGSRALRSRLWGGLPIWAMLAATWIVAAWDIARAIGVVALPRLPVETLPACALLFVLLTLAVFFTGNWRLCHPSGATAPRIAAFLPDPVP
ncbi:hypothetical protein [Jannaschia pohangensis]|uniref:Uncharacterized protein n=1 Tax=Jannaschia pohangensis TaxID=390807 RepID=A0A1I3I8J4_9RHOB|nr:hypothetical protein [Jannaschia pohangensis]SFI44256.1 hypothetical protein SAMN04488095_0858 [Jannaschia pohangensis]